MQIEVTTQIARPIDEVWNLVAVDFTSIARWSASVFTSEVAAAPGAGLNAPVGARYCTFSDDPNGFGALETVRKYDYANYQFEFDVEPKNAPAALPIKHNYVAVSLRSLGPSQCEVTWQVTPTLKLHGRLLSPLLKAGLRKSFQGILDELKAYAERGGEDSVPLAAVG
jgi:hypothetical protein